MKRHIPIECLRATLTLNHISSGIQFVYVVTDYSTNFTIMLLSMRFTSKSSNILINIYLTDY